MLPNVNLDNWLIVFAPILAALVGSYANAPRANYTCKFVSGTVYSCFTTCSALVCLAGKEFSSTVTLFPHVEVSLRSILVLHAMFTLILIVAYQVMNDRVEPKGFVHLGYYGLFIVSLIATLHAALLPNVLSLY
jgi:hypothetical protein